MKSIKALLLNRQEAIGKAVADKKPPWEQNQIEKEIISQIEELIDKLALSGRPFRGRIEIKGIGMCSGEIQKLKIIGKSTSHPKLVFELHNGTTWKKKVRIFEELMDIFSWEIKS